MTLKEFFFGHIKKYEEVFRKECSRFIKSPEAEKSILNTLYGRLMTVFDLFITKALREELGKINPFFEVEPQLATGEVVRQALQTLGNRLENKPSLIPVELINAVISNYECFIKGFFSDFEKNKTGIEQTLFGSQEISEITQVSATSFTGYNQGRFTLIVKANTGTFVYKKHDCRTDVWFYEFLQKFFKGQVYSPKCWADSDKCGFCEFIEKHIPPKEGISDYFTNLGKVTSISCALGLSDLHCENVIPQGAVPTIIDIEMLFQPLNLNSVDQYIYGKRLDTGYSYYLNRSSLGHSIVESDRSPLKAIPNVEFSSELQELFLKGFSEGYDKLIEEKEAVLQEVEKTADYQIRRVLREGEYYKAWIKKLYSSDPDGYLNSIHNIHFPESEKLCNYELQFLIQGNLPYFYSYICSKDLYGTDGNVLIKNFFAKSSWEMVHERLALISQKNKIFELSIIQKVFLQDSKPDFSNNIDFLEYWENQLAESPDGQLFWPGSKKPDSKSMDLPFDVYFGTLFIAKRCALISESTDDESIKLRAQKLLKIGVSCFEQKVSQDKENISKEKLQEGMRAVKFIKQHCQG